MILCSLLTLTLAVGVMAQWRVLPGSTKMAVMPQSGGGRFAASSPSKEYIYAGGRLIATEEPQASPSATLTPTPTPTPTPAPTPAGGPDRSLSVSNGSRVDVPVPAGSTLDLTGPFTVEAWIKPTTTTGTQTILSRYGPEPASVTPDGGYRLRLTDGKLSFSTYINYAQSESLTGATTIGANTWYHVAGVFDGHYMRVYINGRLDGERTSTTAPASGTTPLSIGADPYAGIIYDRFNGLIDEVRVSAGTAYTTDFGPQAHLSAPSGSGLWKFDGDTVEDFSGNSHTGSMEGSPAPTYSTDVPTGAGGTSGSRHSLSLNGANSYLDVPASTTSSLNVTGSMTLEAWIWVDTNSTADYLTIASRYGPEPASVTPDGGYRLSIVQGKLRFSTHINYAQSESVIGDTPITKGAWHHVAGVFDSSGSKLRVYLDGHLDGQVNSTLAPTSGTTSLSIGADPYGGITYDPFKGLIDEVRLSNVALYSIDFSPANALTAAPSSTMGLWKFDGGTTTDSSNYANASTQHNNPGYSTNVPGNISRLELLIPVLVQTFNIINV